ncbi:MAG: helix-turn-helix transcriptional regulator, partial [Planctomycetes bacterium]|nr:helix-turn-helix transcriptional regulator [Planctomycetota bacterium]
MQNQSNLEVVIDRKPLPADFPVSAPDFNTRDDQPASQAHIHDLLEIGYCYAGSGVFLIGDKVLTYREGDAVVINSHEVHVATGNRSGTTRWGFLFLDPGRLLAECAGGYGASLELDRYCGPGFQNVVDGRRRPEIAYTVRRLLEERRMPGTNHRALVRALVWQLLVDLERYCPRPHAQKGTGAAGPVCADFARVLPAINHISEHFADDVTVEDLAALCHASVANFRKLFHRALGCAPQPYLIRVRLNVALSMLRDTADSILDISDACGFRSLSNFNRQFWARFGASPRAARAAA